MPGMSLGTIPDAEIMASYPDAVSLKAAVESGAVDYNRLSPFAQEMVDTAPDVEPVPEEFEEEVQEELRCGAQLVPRVRGQHHPWLWHVLVRD